MPNARLAHLHTKIQILGGREGVYISSIVSITQTSFTIIMDLVQVIQTSLDRWITGLTELISLADQCTAT